MCKLPEEIHFFKPRRILLLVFFRNLRLHTESRFLFILTAHKNKCDTLSPKFLNPMGISCPLTTIYLTVDSVLFTINIMYVTPVCKQGITLSALQLMYFFPPLPCISSHLRPASLWASGAFHDEGKKGPKQKQFSKRDPLPPPPCASLLKDERLPFPSPWPPLLQEAPEEHVLRAPAPGLKTQNFAICPTSVKLHSGQTTLFSRRCVILGKVSGRQDTAINVE